MNRSTPAAMAAILLFLLTPALRAQHTDAAPGHPVQTFRIDQIIRFSMDDGWLVADPVASPDLAGGADVSIAIQGSRAHWTIRSSSPSSASDDHFIELSYRDEDPAEHEGHCQASIQCRSGYTSISGTHRLGSETIYVLYRAWREARTVQVEAYIQEGGELTRTLLNARGASLREVWGDHMPETERYLCPLLRKIVRTNVLGPGAADIYSAFTSLSPQPQATDQLLHLLPQLDAILPTDREAASAQLDRMGRPAVLAAMRLSLPLSPEQHTRLAQFIATHRHLPQAEPAEARRDIPFLLQCLDDQEPAVRQAAKNAIAAAVGHPVEFDTRLEGDARADAIAALARICLPAQP